MVGYLNAGAWLAKRKIFAKTVSGGSSMLSEYGRLNILINLVWPEALIHPNQEEEIANMIHVTLFPENLTIKETYEEARAIAAYLNSMT
jgi:hypothetical protein